MRTSRWVAAGAIALGLLSFAAIPAAAKDDPKAAKDKKPAAPPRWAHSYAAAIAEAKERGCVVFATFHADG